MIIIIIYRIFINFLYFIIKFKIIFSLNLIIIINLYFYFINFLFNYYYYFFLIKY